MPRIPKKKPDAQDKTPKPGDTSSWGNDQTEREYYYDDAHGYETYEPEDDDEQELRKPEPAK